MIGIGTLVNTGAIVAGGLIGLFAGKHFKAEQQDTLIKANGVSVLFIAIAGAMEGMLTIENGALSSGRSMLIVLCLALGALIGEILNIEGRFDAFGEWLKQKSGNANDKDFVNAFVSASLTVCIGAMAIIGSIQDGLLGDYSMLLVKSILDMVIIAVMTASMGKGSIFSAVPIFLFEGGITLLSRFIAPIMTEDAMVSLSLIGSILIFCVGINLVWGKKIRVANLLPAVVLAVISVYLPWNL